MITSLRRLPVFLRASLFGMLMLAIACKPLPSMMCETHLFAHLSAAGLHAPLHGESAAELKLDAEHASGADGLVHAGDQGGTDAGIPFAVTVQVVRVKPALVSPPIELPVPRQHVTKPFRPPIA